MSFFSLEVLIMGALWAASIGALGILTHSLLLISLRRSAIHKDLVLVKRMITDIALFNHSRDSVSKPMQNLLVEIQGDWSNQFEAYLSTTTEGIQVIASVLRPVATLFGLAGTLYGISDALTYASTDPALVMQGFAYAIQTTLVGILVSVMAHITASWIWTPYWKRQRYELYQALSALHKSHAPKPRQRKRKKASPVKKPAPNNADLIEPPIVTQAIKEIQNVEPRNGRRTSGSDPIYRPAGLTCGPVNDTDANHRLLSLGKEPVGAE